MPPTSDEQIRFLVNIQRLLDEGRFATSYKFALLLALADLAVEEGDDSGAALTVSVENIAEKFIQYYWRQAAPYTTAAQARVLQQDTDAGKQAAILNVVGDERRDHSGSLTAAMKRSEWKAIVRNVASVVRAMPLWKLQTVGRERLEFLYKNTGTGRSIQLRPGVAYCFRKFHGLISDLARGAWVRFVRQQNLDILGEAADLREFLFGSERANLAAVRPVMMDLQHGRCFYCGSALKPINTQVDHFIAWARYAVDLGHNFVLADSRCNGQKRDRLPAYEHLANWTERNTKYGDQIQAALEERGVVSQLGASSRVAAWAYAQTEAANGLTWVRDDEMAPLDVRWRDLLNNP